MRILWNGGGGNGCKPPAKPLGLRRRLTEKERLTGTVAFDQLIPITRHLNGFVK
jgi:hypothetical protein